MSYRLKIKEAVPEGLKRIVQEELDSASELLATSKESRDEAIHEARKSLKKIRGVLRLVRPELGEVYREENRRFRDLGRELSEVRDAVAVIEVFDSIAGNYKSQVQPRVLKNVHRALLKKKREMEASTDLNRLAAKTITALRSASRRVKSWPMNKDGYSAIQEGLEETYRRGRRALAEAKTHPAPDTHHYLRKRVKDHWYHIRLLESLWTEVMQARESTLKEIETWLGDDHNLVVLCEMIREDPDAFGRGTDHEVILPLLERRQEELREKAISFAERAYEQKPRQFVRDLSKLWADWQAQPGAVKQVQKAQRREPKMAERNAPPKKTAA
jgi:CHAD domain-containing protein